MGVLRLAGFSGMWPIRDARALPDNAAVEAINIRTDGGAYLNGANQPRLIKELLAGTTSVFRIPLAGENTLENSHWMEFEDINTDVLRAPIVNDSFKRIYWCSPSMGLQYAPEAAIIAGEDGFLVGTPAPPTAPTLSVIAGTGELDPETGLNVAPKVTRAYTATWINVYGEEGQPGPTVEGTGYSDQDWLIENIPQPGSPVDRAGYQKIRLYRTVTGLSGGAQFFKVADLDIGETFYTDRVSESAVSGATELQSTIWALPPEGMQGLVAMPNGIFVSWKDNNLYFCENYRPHAWPAEYTLTVDYPIVGLGVFGNTLVVATTGTPYAVSGVKSSNMASVKIDAPLACLARRSVVSAPEGTYFSTEEGLAIVGMQGSTIVTRDLFSREQWRREYVPETHRSTMIGGSYIALTDLGGSQINGFSFMPAKPSTKGVTFIDIPTFVPVNIGVEPWTGKPWVIGDDHNLYEWEAPGEQGLKYTWMSKEFQYPRPVNFKVFQVWYDNSVYDDEAWLSLRAWVTLRGNSGEIDRVLVYDDLVGPSGREMKFPSGFKGDIWEFEFAGTAEVQSFMIATSVEELRSA